MKLDAIAAVDPMMPYFAAIVARLTGYTDSDQLLIDRTEGTAPAPAIFPPINRTGKAGKKAKYLWRGISISNALPPGRYNRIRRALVAGTDIETAVAADIEAHGPINWEESRCRR